MRPILKENKITKTQLAFHQPYCNNGHMRTVENTRLKSKTGRITCKICEKLAKARRG